MSQRTGVKARNPASNPRHKNTRMHWAVTHRRWTRWRSGERPRLPPKGHSSNLVKSYNFFHRPQVLPLHLPRLAITPTGDKPRTSKLSLNLFQYSISPPWTRVWDRYSVPLLSQKDLKNSSAFWGCCLRLLRTQLRTAHKFLRQFISDDITGHSSTGTLFRRSYSAAMRARCGGALSCWRMADLLFLMYGFTC